MTFFFYFFFNQLPPLLSLAPFVGCIELGSLNNDVISLYNFKETHKMNVVTSTPCLRYATYNYSKLQFAVTSYPILVTSKFQVHCTLQAIE